MQVLSDPQKREVFYQYGEEGLKGQMPPPDAGGYSGMRDGGGGPGGATFRFNPRSADDIFSEFFGFASPFGGMGDMGGGSRGGASGFPRQMFGGDDIFTSFRNASASGEGGSGQRKAAAIKRMLPCSLEDLYKGTTKKMKISRDVMDTSGNFDNHFSYKLASTEVDSLLKRKWKYMWKTPALNMSNCHWRGTGECFIKDPETKSYYGLKPKLYKHWLESYKASGSSDFHQSKQRSFFSICSSYFDILHHNKKPFYLKGLEEDSSIMDAYLMHSLNHIFKSRDLIVKNEKKLAKNQESVESKSVDDDAYRDRGFTRPKVLILLPLAGIMRRVVKRLIQLTPTEQKATVENLERFCEEFGFGRTESNLEDDDLEIPKPKSSGKPPDFQALLGKDDANDHFMIGIKFTNRGIKLYGDFYTSDMIIASPLGLITKIGEAEVEKEKDVDYLSSIEILIIDHADVMLMQNWSHVNTVVEQMNRLPSKQHGTDVMRIRPWYLDGQARFYRQTVILGSHTNPEMNALLNQHCLNYRGKVKLECTYKGVLPKILIQARQIYERFDIESIAEADNDRLKYFCEKVFPKIKDSVQDGVMIFVSSYFEFVRLRNYLKSQSASFCLFGEYIKRNDMSRVRGEFFRGEKKIMLYTERAHFYYRYKIRGVKNLIIYSLPERKEFYPEIVNLLEESDSMNCRVLFSRLDNLRLERIVGSAAAKRMIDSDKGVFVFA
ncbi:U3 small nucleolar RNA-associated protein [Perilla frutescens var. frutescens]|nr:U3 small nucleolar RNA-associated protein [Perilla frutescens var. frutescens]